MKDVKPIGCAGLAVLALAFLGFAQIFGTLHDWSRGTVSWRILDQDSELSDGIIAKHQPLIEGTVSGSWPWEESPRFWLRFKDGKWESAWIADRREIEWREASENQLWNPSYLSTSQVWSE